MKIEEISKLTTAELHKKLKDMRLELAKTKLEITIGASDKSHKVRALKKDIARVLSVINK
jgi:large subunit ribosomal protein L29